MWTWFAGVVVGVGCWLRLVLVGCSGNLVCGALAFGWRLCAGLGVLLLIVLCLMGLCWWYGGFLSFECGVLTGVPAACVWVLF